MTEEKYEVFDSGYGGDEETTDQPGGEAIVPEPRVERQSDVSRPGALAADVEKFLRIRLRAPRRLANRR